MSARAREAMSFAAVGVGDCSVDRFGELGEALHGVGARQSWPVQLAVIAPQSAPSTTTGAPTVMLTFER